MYALKFSKTYDFGIMERNGIQHVLEDKFYADDQIFCVADGVTRDFVDGSQMKYPETMEDVKQILKKYPNPSGAARAAKDCVNNVVTYLKEKQKTNEPVEEEDLKKAVEYANFTIGKINEGRKIDYLAEDKYSCVSVGGILNQEEIQAYVIGDCGMVLLNGQYQAVFDSMRETKDKPDFFIKFGEKYFPKEFNNSHPFYRKYIRKNVRNNLRLLHKGVNNVGILNGDGKAIDFIRYYHFPNNNIQYVLAFSDGCYELINSPEKAKSVIENPESIKEGPCEKTLIIYEKTGE